MTQPLQQPQGVLNVDKPAGLTSARVVSKVKRLLPKGVKIGHAGTLDPFATGVLLLLVGKATRHCEQLMGQPKAYDATIKFGATTATDDLEAEEVPWPGAQPVTLEAIEQALERFVGAIQQRPPVFSALKVGGRRGYDLARQGDAVELAARTVQVYEIEVMEFTWPLLRLRIACGRGTYIRSIARDLGEALNVGGHLTALRRTRIGQFHVEQSVTLEKLLAEGAERWLTPVDPAASAPPREPEV
ncbi:MAG TPA: tRNA pseudouridine(55) synthase TruB [Tepidisphaeraceae bacterium]|jgi:tRNA pseudouridine55 synthase